MVAMLAGVLYIVVALIEFVRPQATVFTSPSDYAIEAAFAAALLFTLVGLVGLYLYHGDRIGRLGTVGFIAAALGTASMFMSVAATTVAGRDVLGLFIFVGVLLALLGVILFGIAVFRTGVFPRWVGVALMLGLPVSVALEPFGGPVLLGLAWVGIGYALRAGSGEHEQTKTTKSEAQTG